MSNPFQEILDAKAAYQKTVKELGKVRFTDYFKEVFDKHPEIESVKWHQYTPFYNDGETCVFGLHGVHVYDKDEKEYMSWGDEPLEKVANDIESQLEAIEDVLQEAFGDHAEVIVTRTGVEVEEYDHE